MKTTMVAFFMVLAHGPIAAESLMEKRELKQQLENMAEDKKAMNDACGTKLDLSLDFKSFGSKESWAPYTPSNRCGDLIRALGSVCSQPDARELVQKKIKGLSCNFGGKGKRMLAKTAGGKFSYTVDWDSGNDYDYLKGEIEKSL